MKFVNTIKTKLRDERGQGLMEYTLIVFLVTMSFWLGVRGTTIGSELANTWAKTVDCVSAPFFCGS
ncbi:MAG: hypothetical protein WD688_09185 [Candidatus Binatia bacterium]